MITRAYPWLVLYPLLLTGCYVMQPAGVPMAAVEHPAGGAEADGLIVLLPGYGDAPHRFERVGMIETIARLAPGFDVVAANAHFGYYQNESIVERLHADVIAPRAGRYQQVWIVGVSMGGAGAASYAMGHPGVVDGVILLAPFMGQSAPRDVNTAGGLVCWTPPPLADIEDSRERHFYRLMSWYRQYASGHPPGTRLMLGYGTSDRLGPANRLLADVLPSEQVVTVPGGHRWTVWMPMFETLLQRAVGAR